MSSSNTVLTMAVGRSRHLLRAALVLAALTAGLWAWTAGLTGPYHFDDYVTPLNDPASQSLAAWSQHLPVTLRPVAKLSYALEAEAGWTGRPAPRRSVSLALQGLAAVLFVLLIHRLSPGTPPLAAALLAALWFIHPVHADSVLMLSGRPAVLSGLFLLAALLAQERARPWLVGLLFVLACLSRETALAGLLPLAVLAFSRPGASWRAALRELAPALVGGALVLTWILTTPRYLQLAEFSFLGRPFWGSLAAQVGAVPVGLGLLFNPTALSIDYGIPLPRSPFEPLFLLGCVLYGVAAMGIVLSVRRWRATAIGLALWLAALLPTQSVVPKLDALTNRPLALALAGLLIAATPFVAKLLAWTMRSLINDSRRLETAAAQAGLRWAGASCALLLVSLLTTSMAARAQLFGSDLALWQDAAAKSTVNARPHLQYALLLLRAGEEVEAGSVLDAAQRIDPFSTQIEVLSRIHPAAEAFP